MKASDAQLTRLCLACGMCCDGTLFKDVELQAGDNAETLRALGIPVNESKFPQPCVALCKDNCCRIYADRPARCRQFECALFLAVKDGINDLESALSVVAQTRKRADKVRRLLRQHGDTEESRALSLRFKRLERAMGKGGFDDEAVEAFSELKLAVNDLTRELKARFYP